MNSPKVVHDTCTRYHPIKNFKIPIVALHRFNLAKQNKAFFSKETLSDAFRCCKEEDGQRIIGRKRTYKEAEDTCTLPYHVAR